MQRIWNHRRTAAVAPLKHAVISDDQVLTYRDLVEGIDRTTAALQRLGIRPGDVVSTDLPIGPEIFMLALACLEQGYGCFPIPLKMILTAADQSATRVAMHVTNVPSENASQLSFKELSALGAGLKPVTGAAAGYVIYATSGTTGLQRVTDKRPSRFPYRGVACSEEHGAGIDFGLHLMTNPSYHRGTLGPALYNLQAGSGVVVMRSFSPNSFVEHINEYQVDSTFLMSGRIQSVLDCGTLPHRRLRSFQHGAIYCPVKVKQAAIEQFGPILHEYYATADLLISEISTAEWLNHIGSVGRPLPGVQVRVIVPNGQVAPPGTEGEIAVLPRLSERRNATDGDFTPTGDAGYVSESGRLYVLGRVTNEGRTEYAVVERAIRNLPHVFDAAVIKTNDEVHCRVERLASDEADHQLHRVVEELVRAAWTETTFIEIRPAGFFNRTESGKLRRTLDRNQRP